MATDPALTAPHEHRAGDTIAGRYVLRQKLGEGGMGVVWVARSTALDVDIALKMLKRELAGTEAVQRMAREARTAAQLGHPAMVRVLDFGTSELGEPFLAMELLEGEELHAKLQREQRLPAATAIGLLLPIIDGLGTAHEKGIVHRDIKPENIFIASDGQHRVQPKVLDFGIAKLAGDRAPSRLTQVGAVMGSPYYLSPEQAEGLDDIDFRCDIWSVGVVLYELLTGAPPFAANNYNAQIRSILNDKPKPITELGIGDQQLWLIIERCLQKDREQRWASIWELGEALALWLFERGVRVDAASRSLKHGWLDGTVTGVQILVGSSAPQAEPERLPPVIIAPQPKVSRPEQLAVTHLRPRRRRGLPIGSMLLATGALLALGGALWYRSQRSPSVPVGAESQSKAAVASEVSPAAPPPVAPAALSAEPAPPAPVAPAAPSEAAPSASSLAASGEAALGAAARAAPSAGGAKSRVKLASPKALPRSTAAATGDRTRHNTEFGF